MSGNFLNHRFLALLACLLGGLLPACTQGSAGPPIEFSDGFQMAPSEPDPNWTVVLGGLNLSSSFGNPAPSFYCPAGRATYLRAIPQFSSSLPLTLSVDMAVSKPDADGATTATIRLYNDRTADFGAEVNVFQDSSGSGERYLVGNEQYYLPGTAVTKPLPPDGSFHRYEFSLNRYGTARWKRDGVLMQTMASFPEDLHLILVLSCQLTVNDRSAPVYFDNVRVTQP